MNIVDLGHYAPKIHIALCFILIIGLSLPTIRKPNTWHMTLFIVASMSAINWFASYMYADLISYEALEKAGGSFDDLKSKAYRAWKMDYARVYSFLGALDLLTFALVRRFSQRGRRTIAILMASFAIIHLLTSIKLVSGIIVSGGDTFLFISFFRWLDLHSTIYYVYSNYDALILYLNVIQIAILMIGVRGEWNSTNIGRFASGVIFSGRSGNLINNIWHMCNLLKYQSHNKGRKSW